MNETQPSRSQQEVVRRLHVIPVGDAEIHAAQESCWCYPTETHQSVWVHHAKDCREAKERATGEGCSPGWVNIIENVRPNPSTPDTSLPPLGDGPQRKMVIEIEVTADFEKRLDNQWMVEREIHADRWNWRWADTPNDKADRPAGRNSKTV